MLIISNREVELTAIEQIASDRFDEKLDEGMGIHDAASWTMWAMCWDYSASPKSTTARRPHDDFHDWLIGEGVFV